MKNYTVHFLLITLFTLILGFTGLEYPGAAAVRFICLISGIGLFLSCLDAVLLSRRQGKLNKKVRAEKVKSTNRH